MHFLAPTFFDGIIPPVLPGRPRTYTLVSGAAAWGIGAGLAVPRTRRVSADLATVFFVGVLPAKVQLTVDWCRGDRTSAAKAVAVAQLFWQIPLITEARRARRDAE